jgi:O-antigen/teichoic acid export membrane protein
MMMPADRQDRATLLRPHVTKSIAGTAITSVALGGLGIATGVIAARSLGPVGRGEIAAIQMWPSAIAAFAMIGLPEALVYFSARHPSESRQYLLSGVLAASVVMPAFALLGYVVMPFLLSTQSDRIVQGARAYLWLLPVFALVGLPHQLLRGIQDYQVWNALRLLPAVLWLMVLVLALWLGTTDPTRITGAYLGLLAGIGMVVTWTAWTRSVGSAAPTASTVSSMVRFGLPSALSTLPQFFNLRLDQMAVAATLPARQLGVYVTAVAWSACVPMLSSALGVIVSPRIAAEAMESERRRRLTQGIQGAAWLIAVPVAVLAAVTPFGITAVFGGAFKEAALPALILVIASGVNAFNGTLEELLRGFGRPGATLFAETVAVAAGLPALLFLLPLTGLIGASIASLVGYVAATIVLVWYSRRTVGVDVLRVIDPRRLRWSQVSAHTVRVLRLRLGQP